jgi:hypothetical protein
MKAILTKYHGATNTRGARVSAADMDRNRVSIPYPHELSGEAVHVAAAQALCDKMNWPGKRVVGSLGVGFVHVFVPDSEGDN